jgi:chromate transporter
MLVPTAWEERVGEVSEPNEDRRQPAVASTVTDVGLPAIFFAFLRLGCTSFGGGTGGWVYREMVQRRGWLDEREFLGDLALGQSLPGANGVKMSVLVGRRLRGGAGAFAAAAALLIGPFAIILAVGAVYGRIGDHRILHAVLDGVAAAVVGLTFATGISSLVRGAANPAAIAVAAATVMCVGVLRWPMLPVIAGLAPVSIGLAWARARRRAADA